MSAQQTAHHIGDLGRLCNRDPISIEPTADIVAAAGLMREKHIGFLVVAEMQPARGGKRVVGVLTDRDIVVAVVAREVDPRDLRVSDVMTPNPLIVSEECSIDAALGFMRDAGVRRVPVVRADGNLCGVLSLDDVLERLAAQLSSVAGCIRSEQRAERIVRP
ncbi:MAG: CBS domain-containing protein [Steroidobacteraceae bacterium]|nr:CBS domain-containing protein [Steroidobacteraceae bacterium]